MDQLKECPKCGSDDISIRENWYKPTKRYLCAITCFSCHYSINGTDKDILLKEWNVPKGGN